MSRSLPPHIVATAEHVAHAATTQNRLGKRALDFLRAGQDRPIKPEEQVKVIARRMIKAERDERVNITQAITPEKTYMAGFTRPKELRASNWFPGGAYLAQGKVYESPVDEAYQPYTVFMLESRHTVRYGVGRVEAEEWIYGACREPDLLKVLKKYNSDTAPQYVLEAMDNARWPEGPQLKPKPQQVWWLDAEDLRQTHEELGIPEYKSRRLEIKAHYLRTYFRKTGNSTRAFHSSPILLANQNLQSSPSIFLPDAIEEWDYLQTPRQPNADAVTRAEYIPTLRDTPFWRPLITITTASRPIALSILRRCHGLDRGLPYHSVLDNDDKKCRASYALRMRTIRINRMRQIALQLAQSLAGFRGGLVGVRFEADTMGRGIAGEALADPIPYDKRVLSIGVAQWYRLADETKELLRSEAEESIPGPDAFEMYSLDDWGNRTSDKTGEVVPWRAYKETPVVRLKREAWYKEYVHLLLAEKAFATWASEKQAARKPMLIRAAFKPKQPPKVNAPLAQRKRDDEEEEEEKEDEIELNEEVEEEKKDVVETQPPKGKNRKARRAQRKHDEGEDEDEEEVKEDDIVLNEELEAEEDEEVEVEEKHEWRGPLNTPQNHPLVYMTPTSFQAFLKSRTDTFDSSYLTNATPYPDFVLCKPNGKAVVGERSPETGKIETKGMIRIAPTYGRLVVKRRLEMYNYTRTFQLAMIIAAQSGGGRIDSPKFLQNNRT